MSMALKMLSASLNTSNVVEDYFCHMFVFNVHYITLT